MYNLKEPIWAIQRKEDQNHQFLYKVIWKNQPLSQFTWETKESLSKWPHVIDTYDKKNPIINKIPIKEQCVQQQRQQIKYSSVVVNQKNIARKQSQFNQQSQINDQDNQPLYQPQEEQVNQSESFISEKNSSKFFVDEQMEEEGLRKQNIIKKSTKNRPIRSNEVFEQFMVYLSKQRESQLKIITARKNKGRLQFYVVMKNGDKVILSNEQMRYRYSQQLIDFYQTKVKWSEKSNQNMNTKYQR